MHNQSVIWWWMVIFVELSTVVLVLGGTTHEQFENKNALRLRAKEMFMHGYNSYMKYAYPADELMPLTCQGRQRGVTKSRGDVDDSLGNFSLTLVDALDSLVVVGELDEFEKAVRLVVDNVRFDSNLVVSVFETNIRMVGGLISAHVLAKLVQSKEPDRLKWYSDHLLQMATKLADALLPAFNTTSGVPYSRINLKYGMLEYLREQRNTCTACGGTMILEFAALSRLTGKPIYEEKARKAMDFLWAQRNRATDLMGTILNVDSGDWIRRDAGIGAGIDSYYEYCLKGYILLGDNDYLHRFNKHYSAIMRYINKGPIFIDVHMHKPTVATRTYMDALLAFWPGLQVLKGDLKSAIELHEMLFQVVKRHKFLPEAFTHDLQIHWAQHPIRPEFIESTYLLYRATNDPHYLRVAENVMQSVDKYLRVDCGFAAVKDIRSMKHENRMDSFVLAETFKYLYMIFSDPDDLPIDPNNYILTTEAHFIPLSIGDSDRGNKLPRRLMIDPDELIGDVSISSKKFRSACPNPLNANNIADLPTYAAELRLNVQSVVEELTRSSATSGNTCSKGSSVNAWSFSATNRDHLRQLKQMGIKMLIQSDGQMQLSHFPETALNVQWADLGSEFIKEMLAIANDLNKLDHDWIDDRIVQIVTPPHYGTVWTKGSPAHFGKQLENDAIEAEVCIANPFRACRPLSNGPSMRGKIAVVQRQDCMFQEKARYVQESGAVGLIVIDDSAGSSAETSPPFAMSGDQEVEDDIHIPSIFVYNMEGLLLMKHIKMHPNTVVRISDRMANPVYVFAESLKKGQLVLPNPPIVTSPFQEVDKKGIMVVDTSLAVVIFNFRFESIDESSEMERKQAVVGENVRRMQKEYSLANDDETLQFYNVVSHLAHWLLGMNTYPSEAQLLQMSQYLPKLLRSNVENEGELRGPITRVLCSLHEKPFKCMRYNR